MKSQDIRFKFNTQHDCQFSKCTASGERVIIQERIATGLVEKVIEHKNTERYIINTAALHNDHLLRRALPRHLTKPIPLLGNRKATHDELALSLRKLRVTADKKRDDAKEAKRKAEAAKTSEAAEAQGGESADLAEAANASSGPRRKRTRAE